MLRDCLVAPARVHVWVMSQGQGCGFDDEIVNTNFYDFIHLLPQRHQIRDVVIDSQVEMRDGSGRLRQPLGDRATHRGEGDLLLLECRGALQAARRRAKARRYTLDVPRDDPAARSTALNRVEADAHFAGHLPRHRRRTWSAAFYDT